MLVELPARELALLFAAEGGRLPGDGLGGSAQEGIGNDNRSCSPSSSYVFPSGVTPLFARASLIFRLMKLSN